MGLIPRSSAAKEISFSSNTSSALLRGSLFRVEADGVTYNLPIFLRFELEQDLREGRLRVVDLPDAWSAKIEAYLGLTPPDEALGVLQDIHWSVELMGRFPTYVLGNLL
jgi:carboxypeptidase Taq